MNNVYIFHCTKRFRLNIFQIKGLTNEYKSLCINFFKKIINWLTSGGAFIMYTAVKRMGRAVYKNGHLKSNNFQSLCDYAMGDNAFEKYYYC